jgi:hypothetical protein
VKPAAVTKTAKRVRNIARARHQGPGRGAHLLLADRDLEFAVEDVEVRVPEHRDHEFEAIVITHSRAS